MRERLRRFRFRRRREKTAIVCIEREGLYIVGGAAVRMRCTKIDIPVPIRRHAKHSGEGIGYFLYDLRVAAGACGTQLPHFVAINQIYLSDLARRYQKLLVREP